jgi:hypothetical protein
MKQIAFSFALIIALSVSMYGQEFELNAGGSVTAPTQPMIRSSQVGIGFTAPTSGTYPSPSVARLIVQNGNIGHFVNGQYGGFGSTDQWLGLGLAGVGTAYGLAITKNTNTGVFNLLDEGTQTNLIAGFGGTASTNTNRFKIRGFSGTTLTSKDLFIVNPNGAVGVNVEPLATVWVDSKETTSSSLFRDIAIIGRQTAGSGNITTASALGNQQNTSLVSNNVAVEGFRAQFPDFATAATQSPLTGGAVNLQVVNNPLGNTDVIASSSSITGNKEYAELSWQDLDFGDTAVVDCSIFPITDAQRVDKFFISFRNNQSNNPFDVNNKLPVMTFQANGRVGIGTLQPTSGSCGPGNKQTILLDVNGLINAGGALVTSDRRFKKDIEKIPNSLELVRKIQGTKYHFNQEDFPERNFGGGLQYGFIAQELEQVIPEATVLNSDGYYAVNYTMLIPVLTEAIKEQDKTVTELRNELAELRSQINDLKAGQQSGDLKGYRLDQNTPNPTGGNTVIAYAVPAGTNGARITVYDLAGRTIQSWSLSDLEGQITINASTLSGGLYIYDLQVGGRQVLERKMSVIGK